MSPPPVVLTSFEVNVARRLAREEHPALLRMQASSHATDLSCAEFVERVIARPPFELVEALRELVAEETARGRLGEDPNAHLL